MQGKLLKNSEKQMDSQLKGLCLKEYKFESVKHKI